MKLRDLILAVAAVATAASSLVATAVHAQAAAHALGQPVRGIGGGGQVRSH